MSEQVVGGDPDLLEAYSEEVLALFPAVEEALTAYRDAVAAFTAAPSEMDVSVTDRSLDVEQGLFDLEEADRIPGAFGELLRELDGSWTDTVLAELIAEDPEVAARLAGGWSDGEVQGEEAIALLLAFFDRVETAGQDADDADGKLSRDDLERIADDEDQPEALRRAAQWMLDHEDTYDLADGIEDRGTDGEISDEDLVEVLVMNRHLRNLEPVIDEVDVAADDDGETDGHISFDDLEAVANGEGDFTEEQRAAAAYLLGTPQVLLSDPQDRGIDTEDVYERLDQGQAFANESPRIRQEFDTNRAEEMAGESAPQLSDVQIDAVVEEARAVYEDLDNLGGGVYGQIEAGPVEASGAFVVTPEDFGTVETLGVGLPNDVSAEVGVVYTNAESIEDLRDWSVTFSVDGGEVVTGSVNVSASIDPEALTNPNVPLFTGTIMVAPAAGVGVGAPAMTDASITFTQVQDWTHNPIGGAINEGRQADIDLPDIDLPDLVPNPASLAP